MPEERSFQEMLRQYNRALMQMQNAQEEDGNSETSAFLTSDSTEGTFRPQPQPSQMEVSAIGEGCSGAGRPDIDSPAEITGTITQDSQSPINLQSVESIFMQHHILHETLADFIQPELPPRTVHVKGYGAFGHFVPYQSMAEYTSAAFLQGPDITTSVFVRFSKAIGNKGAPDTARDICGFATKFYTQDGIFDLVGNHLPVFFVRDALQFPAVMDALSPNPQNNLPDPERFWSFIARTPEAIHMLMWLYSDLGTIKSFRTIRGYGVNTFVWRNAAGKRRYVKYHWLPVMGEACISRQEAIRLAGENPDIAGRDLYDAIRQGEGAEYELCVQLMDPNTAAGLPFDPLDDTKIWDEKQFPLLPVGKMVLDRNPDHYLPQVEKSAFSPANLVEGIELSGDRMLLGRALIYGDAQRQRLGADFRRLPINRGTVQKELSFQEKGKTLCEQVPLRCIQEPEPDPYTQAGERYRSLSPTGREHLADNIACELFLAGDETRHGVFSQLSLADPELAEMVLQRSELYQNS